MAQSTSSSGAQADDPVAGQAVTVNILKGGVGKSAISLNLADRLAARGHRVLYMDLDPNGHVSYGLGFEEIYSDGDHDLGEILLDNPTKEPTDVIYETDFGFDFVPSSYRLEELDTRLKNVTQGTLRLHRRFFVPLIQNDEYDYIVMDGGGERSKIADSAYVGSKQTIIPMEPGPESISGFKKTWNRVIKKIREFTPFEILAIVPNKLSQRIDQQTADRELIEYLNTSDRFSDKVPSFARFTREELDQLDRGELTPLPKPGIRQDSAFSNAYRQGMPLAHHDPDSPTVDHLDELARIVEQGGINHE